MGGKPLFQGQGDEKNDGAGRAHWAHEDNSQRAPTSRGCSLSKGTHFPFKTGFSRHSRQPEFCPRLIRPDVQMSAASRLSQQDCHVPRTLWLDSTDLFPDSRTLYLKGKGAHAHNRSPKRLLEGRNPPLPPLECPGRLPGPSAQTLLAASDSLKIQFWRSFKYTCKLSTTEQGKLARNQPVLQTKEFSLSRHLEAVCLTRKPCGDVSESRPFCTGRRTAEPSHPRAGGEFLGLTPRQVKTRESCSHPVQASAVQDRAKGHTVHRSWLNSPQPTAAPAENGQWTHSMGLLHNPQAWGHQDGRRAILD